jgi:pimeloyl-ACP methyl ester carboxylesterase
MANIILVHGAFVDGSCWAQVIPLLWKAGHRAIAVQNPTTTLEDDIAAAKKAMREASGSPTVLVGHSYGGTIISAVGSGERDVIGLVYVAGFANDQGQSIDDIVAKYPTTDALKAVRADESGWSILDRGSFPEVFAGDVPIEQAKLMAVSQQKLGPACFATPLPVEPAWKKIPSWYVLSEKDRTVHPKAQRDMATKIGAKVMSIPASHASPVSRPDAIAEAIIKAATQKAFVTG